MEFLPIQLQQYTPEQLAKSTSGRGGAPNLEIRQFPSFDEVSAALFHGAKIVEFH